LHAQQSPHLLSLLSHRRYQIQQQLLQLVVQLAVCLLAAFTLAPQAKALVPPSTAGERVTSDELSALQTSSLIDSNKALPDIIKFVNRLEPIDSHDLQLRAFILFANTLMISSFSDAAEKFLPQAIKLAQVSDNTVALSHLKLLHIGTAFYTSNVRLNPEAIRPLVKIIMSDTDRVQYAQTLANIASIASDSRATELTLELIGPLKSLYLSNPKLADVEDRYWQLYSSVLEQTDDFDGALTALNKALDIATSRQHLSSVALYHYNLGDMYALKMDWLNTRKHLTESYSVAKQNNDLSGLTWAATRLAVAYVNRDSPADDIEARKWADIALPLQPKLEDRNGLAEIEMVMAELALRNHDMARAEQFYQIVKNKHEILVGRNVKYFHKLGLALAFAKGDYKLAQEESLKLNTIIEEIGNRRTQRKMAGLRSLLANSEAERAEQTRREQQHDKDARDERDKLLMVIASLGAALLIGISVTAVQLYRRSIRFRRLSEVDELTGISSRRAIVTVCQRAIKLANGRGDAFSIAVFDLDNFKQLNDRYGHSGGDAFLKRIANVVRAGLGEQYTIGRLGGDEFLVAMPGANEALSRQIAQQIVELAHSVDYSRDQTWHATVSVGIATLSGKSDSYAKLYSRADKALYAAKDRGRDQCTHAISLGDAAFVTSQIGATFPAPGKMSVH
jgi:diguanylate cyclase (GGDEF)-like protein